MKEFLATVPPEQWIQAAIAVGVISLALFGWIGRTIAKALEKTTSVRFNDSAYRQIDLVAAWAAKSTEQAFKNYVLAPEQTLDDKNAEKRDAALKQARAQLSPEVNEKIDDKELVAVIESKIAETKVGAAAAANPSIAPPRMN